MTAAWIVRTLRKHGVSVRTHDGELVVDAPFGVLKELDRMILDEQRHEIVEYLTTTETAEPSARHSAVRERV